MAFYEAIKYDKLITSQNSDGKVKSSLCKTRES